VASIISRVGMAVKAGIAAFRNPDSNGSTALEPRSYFNLWWAYYLNSTFDNVAAWQTYRTNHVLYRNIRSIYNPTRRIVNFYVAQIYPGVLSEDASRLPDGVQLAIPLSEDTDDDLRAAIAQFWQWSNWQSGNKVMVRFGAATGSCLVEIVDNVEKGKVTSAVRWPGLIADKAIDDGASLVLDDVGNVKFYALEYEATDERGDTYTYRKEVSQEAFRYYRNDKIESEAENPYGFVPAVWCKHIDEGWGFGGFTGEQNYGSPAIAGALGKIDELNGIVSHTHDQIDILVASPGIIATSGNVGNIVADSNRTATAQDEYNATASLADKPTKRPLLKGPADTKWVPMNGNLQPEQVIPHMDRLLSEIEHDFPELGMYQELRKMSQVTGPGAARMMGDVYSRVLEVSSNYDTQSIKLFQMAAAIGGHRYRENKEGWRLRTEQQAKFAPFSLDSYARGELNLDIMPRPLIPMTEADTIDLTGKRLDNAKKAKEVFSEGRVLEIAGISNEEDQAAEIALLKTEREAKAALIPSAPKPPNGDSQLIQ
jgi:hypothetical protein